MDTIHTKDDLKPEYKKLILKAIDYHFSHAKVILFGSRARDTHKPGSDIDIAVDIGNPIPLSEMSRLRVTLENLPLAFEIDVVDMHNIPVELKDLILDEGIVWKN
jgi:predicted nucleotidyltransferase